MQDVENNTIGYHICNLKEKLFSVRRCFMSWSEIKVMKR